MWSTRTRVTALAVVATITVALTAAYLTYRKTSEEDKEALCRKGSDTHVDPKQLPSSSSSSALPTTSVASIDNPGKCSEKDELLNATKHDPVPATLLRLSDAIKPKMITIWYTKWISGHDKDGSHQWPTQFGNCLHKQLSVVNEGGARFQVETKILESEDAPEVFANHSGPNRLNLLIVPSNSEGEMATAYRRMQNWLRSFIARRDNDPGSNIEAANVEAQEDQMSNFFFQVLGVDIDAAQDGALVYCSVANELDRLLALAGCKRFASMYTLTSHMSSRRGYVRSLLDTLEALPPPQSEGRVQSRHRVGLFYASWSSVSKTFAFELREILKDFLPAPVDAVDVRCMGTLTVDDLVSNYETAVFLVSSYTYGDPPPAVSVFWNEVCRDREAGRERLSSLSFGILGLGDTTYFSDCFCKAAYDLEALLMACGGCRILPLATCDQMLGQQPLQFRLWANTILGPSLKRHVSYPSEITAALAKSEAPPSREQSQVQARSSETEVPPSSTDSDPASPSSHKHMLILFGTQSGTSERYARDLEKRIIANYNVSLQCLDIEELDPGSLPLVRPSFVVFVVSTWGDGDPPDSCQQFHRNLVAKESQLMAFFTGVSYCIVALGNSGYPNFCGYAVKLSRALRAIPGTVRKLPIVKLDENDDPEARFEKWWTSSFHKEASESFEPLEHPPVKLPSQASLCHLLPEGVFFKLVPCQRKHDTTPAQHKCHQSLQSTVPLSALSKDVYRSSIQFEIVDCRVFGADNLDPCLRYVYEVTVQSTRALDETSFYPGSTFGFYPEQSPEDSQWLLDEVFEWQGLPASTVAKEVVVFEGKEPIRSPLPQGVTLREIVESLTDFGATPPHAWLHQDLYSLLPDSHPYKLSEAYKADFDLLVKTVPLTTLEALKVLHNESAFKLPVEFLLCMKRQTIRQYTVASSIDRDRGIFQLIVSETSMERHVPPGLKSLVQPQLKGLVSQMLRKLYTAKSTQIIRGLSKPALFEPHTWQLGGVWIATGSGIAPFIGFLEERRLFGLQSFGRTILFFGCRSSGDTDFIGKATILAAVRDGFLDAAFFAFSRDQICSRAFVKHGQHDLEVVHNAEGLGASDNDGAPASLDGVFKRVYVQDRVQEEISLLTDVLESHAEEVSVRPESETAFGGDDTSTATKRLVTHKIMICGSSAMGKAVTKVLTGALGEEKLAGSVLMEVW